MPATGTTEMADEVKALYDGDFLFTGQSQLYWDQFSDTKIVMSGGRQGNTYNFPFIHSA